MQYINDNIQSAMYNKRFCEIGGKVITLTLEGLITVSDNPNGVQLRSNFAKQRRSLGDGFQEQLPNHLMLRLSKGLRGER